MTVLFLLALLASAVAAVHTWQRLRFFLGGVQATGYDPGRYGAWLRTEASDRLVAPAQAAGFGLLLALAFWVGRSPVASASAAALGWSVAFGVSAFTARPGPALRFTDPMRRQATAALAMAAVPVLVGLFECRAAYGAAGLVPLLAGWLVADLLAPLWAVLGGLVLAPTDDPPADAFDGQTAARWPSEDSSGEDLLTESDFTESDFTESDFIEPDDPDA